MVETEEGRIAIEDTIRINSMTLDELLAFQQKSKEDFYAVGTEVFDILRSYTNWALTILEE